MHDIAVQFNSFAALRLGSPPIASTETVSRHNNQASALITAAINPIEPATNENALINPPRTVGESESATPISPDTIATTASTNPQNAPVVKLSSAATIAMRDGTLNFALRASPFSMSQVIQAFQRRNQEKYQSVE
jgi:hypothetical protein